MCLYVICLLYTCKLFHRYITLIHMKCIFNILCVVFDNQKTADSLKLIHANFFETPGPPRRGGTST